jgi:hypothetical protein
MTAAALPAYGRAVAVRRPRTDTIEVCPKPISRQARARRVMFTVAAICIAVASLATAQQVAAHGWRAFVFRAPGVGGTPPASSDVAAATTAGPTSVVPRVAPTLPAGSRHLRPIHRHHIRQPHGAPRWVAPSRSGQPAGRPVSAPSPVLSSVPSSPTAVTPTASSPLAGPLEVDPPPGASPPRPPPGAPPRGVPPMPPPRDPRPLPRERATVY